MICGHVLGGSVVISWVSLWSVIISWLVVYGHIVGGSVVIFWLRNHFLGRGLWSYPRWVCGHILGGSVVIS